MKSGWKKTVTVVICAGLAAGMLAGCSKKEDSFDADATAMTVNGEEISAGLLNFAAHYTQSQYQYIYDMYYGENSFSVEVSTGYTIGDMVKEESFESIEELVLARQHAEDYGVSLTDEEQAAIAEAAEQFIESNDEDLLQKMSATKENVEEYLNLMTVESKMEPEMTADVDTEVSDEEAAQRRIRYVLVPAETEDDEDDEEEVVVTDEDESEEETEDPAWLAAMDEAYEKAEEIISLVEDGTDFDDAIEEVDDSLSSYEITFGDDDTTVVEGLVTATDGLGDDTLVTTPVEASTGYYVVYVVNELDREATDEEKESIIEDRKEEAITALFEDWVDEADLEMDDDVIASIVYDYNLDIVYDEEDETDLYDEDETDWADEDETDWADEDETDWADEDETDWIDEDETEWVEEESESEN